MEIIIGRESGAEAPRLSVKCGGKELFIGKPGSVGRKVSRAHCSIQLCDDGTIKSITDLTDNNYMFVNGQECKKKNNISLNDTVELGPDRYKLNLREVIRAALGEQAFHIAPLKIIYEDYQEQLFKIQIGQGRLGAISSLPMILSMLSGIIIGVVPGIPQAFRFILIGIALILMVVFLVLRLKNAEAIPLKKKQLEEKFHKQYVCPNPCCRHYLGSIRYEDLLNGKACPYCKSRFIE